MKKHSVRTATLSVVVTMLLMAVGGCSTTTKSAKPSPHNSSSVRATSYTTWLTPNLKAVSDPTAADNEFFVTAQNADKSLVGTAVDAVTGKVLWQDPMVLAGRIAGVGIPSPTPLEGSKGWVITQLEGNGGQIAAGDPFAYVGRDPRTGRVMWRFPVNDSTQSAACGKLLCVDTLASDGSAALVAVDPATGTQKWSLTLDGQFALVDVNATTVFMQTLSTGTTVIAVDLATGKKKWSVPVQESLGVGVTTDSGWNGGLLGKTLLIDVDSDGTTPGGTIGLDAATGALWWVKRNMHLPTVTLNALVSSGSHATPPAPSTTQDVVLEESTFTKTAYVLKAFTSIDLVTGKATWTKPVNRTITEKTFQPMAVVSDSLRDVWPVLDGKTASSGFSVATGKLAPTSSTGWLVQLGKGSGPGGQIAVLGESDPYTPPVTATSVIVPGLARAGGGGGPPASVSATGTSMRAWVTSDLQLHGISLR